METKPAAPEDKRRLTPPIWWWLLFALAIAAIAWLQLGDAMDHQIANLISFSLAGITIILLIAWFVLLSGYPRAVRFLSALALILAVGLFFWRYRVKEVSGELVPTFTLRHAPRHDQTLEQPKPDTTASVDLSPTPLDFPQFLGPDRDLNVQTVTLSRDWQRQPPKRLWRQPIGAGWSAFTAVNGFAVTLEQRDDQEFVTCYEIDTGTLRWAHGVSARHEELLGGIGPRSTPTIHEGKVYALGATGVLRCLSGADGSEIWTKDLRREFGVSPADDEGNIKWGRAGSPLIVDHRVIVTAGGPSGSPVSLVAYDKDSGEEIWRGGDQQISYASPALATLGGTPQILIVNEATVTGHDVETGETLWSHPWPGSSHADASASQAVALPDDRVLISKAYSGGAALIQVAQSGDGFRTQELWREPKLLRTKFTNVAIKDGYAYGLSDGILQCVEIEAGRAAWKKGRYGQGQILLVGDLILVQAESGEVALVEASPEQFNELGRFAAVEGKTWNNLCLYGSRLLVRNGEQAACFELPVERIEGEQGDPEKAEAAE